MNGKSVEVDNTDAEGRLVLAGMQFYHWLQTPIYLSLY
jgi:leucyl aminopeptidase